MPRLLTAVLAALLLTASYAHAGVIPERIVKAAQEHVAAGEYPVLVIGMIKDGKTEIAGFGVLPDGKAPDGDTVFEIGSITKTFTATLLADAVTRGDVSLDDPVAKLLPGVTIPMRDGKQITLGEIAEQRSGLPRMPTNFAPADPANPYADYDAAHLKAFLAVYPLPRDPGASYEYSNLGFGLLGYALATHAGTDYPTLLRQKILAPLKMNDTGIALTPRMQAHLAPGHDDTGKPAKNWDLDALAGAGAIRSTVKDMLRYLRANMGAVHTPLDAAMALAHAPRADMLPDKLNRIGLAWMTFTLLNGPTITWHNGGTGGYASAAGFTADGRQAIVMLTNTQIDIADFAEAALDPTAAIKPPHKIVALTTAELEAYTGSYRVNDKLTLVVSRLNDRLYAQATGQPPFAIFPTAPNEFFARLGGIAITFARDAKGAVMALVLHQGGDTTAPRLLDAPAFTVDAATLAGYAGKYQLAPGLVIDITVADGQLMAQLTGQPAVPVYASAKDRFFYKIVDAQLDFERDTKGAVAALVLHQNGRDLRAPRSAP